MLPELELSFDNETSENNFTYDTFQCILSDLHSNPCKVMELGYKDIENIMKIKNNEIKLKKSIVIIYSRLRLLGFF